MKKILSIDPAIKNLAIVTMTINDGDVFDLECKLIDLCKGKKAKTLKFETMMNNLLDELGKINMENFDVVLIENIPSLKNPSVKSVSVAIYTYYKMKNFEVHLVSPSRKLNKEENKLSYNDRKKASVNKALALLNDEDKLKVQAFKKQDDIADSINMAMAFF
jgi:hypothetical protein